eukprot:TRINITY_DN35910_c0_g1_i1.p1 TRINITY_DN35910_c0_g1~~TRINITY_DN35910_c0_g1_i1.p1  ORF type:complete len:146 (+),score=25.66 TRINITY_DN35910_c0_g1_i1:389-826(+)
MLHPLRPPPTYEWPDGDIELQTSPSLAEFNRKYSVTLEPGHYVLTINQDIIDCKSEVFMYVSFFADADEDGVTSNPFPAMNSGNGKTRIKSHSTQSSQLRITAESMGSIEKPKIIIKKTRPRTPREELFERMQKAKDADRTVDGT